MLAPIDLRPRAAGVSPKVIRVQQGARKQVVFRLLDDDGSPVDISKDPSPMGVEPARFGTQKPASDGTSKLKLIARDGQGGAVIADLMGERIEDSCGHVQFLLPVESTRLPGMFIAEIGWFVTPDILIASWPCYMLVEPSVFAETPYDRQGAISVSEVRLEMFDHEIRDTSLLDALEFTDLEIISAASGIVETWNETPPSLSGHVYTPANFPWRQTWISATVGSLLRSAALRYLRDYMPHQAGGITIQDQNKFNEYQARGDQLLKEFEQWMMRKKSELNLKRAWGGSGIRY